MLALVRALSTLRRVLREYVAYYNESRRHLALDGDAPKPRDVEHGDGQVVAKTEAPIGAVVPPTHFAQPRQARTPGTQRTRRKKPKRARGNHQPARPRGS